MTTSHNRSGRADAPPKRPESVLVVVYTRSAEVLLLQRADDAAFWQSVTGSLEAGELPAVTAARELQEETGLIAPHIEDCQFSQYFEIRPQWRYRYPPGTMRNLEHVFLAEFAHPDAAPVHLHAAEHTAYRWMPIVESIDACWSSTNRDAISRFVLPRFATE